MPFKSFLISWLLLSCASPTFGKDSKDDDSKNNWVSDWKGMWLPIGAGVAAVAVAPVALGAAGFTGAGVAAGSLAAYLQGTGILAGSTLATLQGAGAAGLGWGGSAAVFGTGAGIGAWFASKIECDRSTKDSSEN